MKTVNSEDDDGHSGGGQGGGPTCCGAALLSPDGCDVQAAENFDQQSFVMVFARPETLDHNLDGGGGG